MLCQARPGEIRARLPKHPPENGEPFDEVMRDLDRIVVPGLTHWQSPSFFAFFPSNNSGSSVLGELLAAGLGVQGMLWATSPACTELETHVLDWLADLLDLPAAFRSDGPGGGVIQDTASSRDPPPPCWSPGSGLPDSSPTGSGFAPRWWLTAPRSRTPRY